MTEPGGPSKAKSLAVRAGWGIADQALSSITNFALGIYAARSLTQRDFGAFSVAFATYLIVLGVNRAVSSEPLVVKYSGSPTREWMEGVRVGSGASLAVGLLGGAACVIAAGIMDGVVGRALAPMGVALPPLLLQDYWRWSFFSQGQPQRAFINDLAWASCMFPGIILLARLDNIDVRALIAVWSGSAGIAALVGIKQTRCRPNLRTARIWWTRHRDLAGRYVWEFGATMGAPQLALYGIGGVLGLSAAGAFRAAQIILGPVNLLFMGGGMVATAEAVNVQAKPEADLRHFCLRISALLASGGAVWGAIVMSIPDSAGEFVLKGTWADARPLILPLTVGMIASGLAMGAGAGLRALADARASLRARLVVAPLITFGTVGGAYWGGILSAAWALALALVIGSLVWWHQFTKSLISAKNPNGRTTG